MSFCLRINDAVLLDALVSVLNRRELPQESFEKLLRASQEITGGGIHYSQEGEDIVLARLLPQEKIGFFVDIGAHHPVRFSNTYALYRQGWRGINIDATPGSMEAFKERRPEDINLEAGVSDSAVAIMFHVFDESALNTFNATLAEEYVDSGYKRTGIVKIVPRTLASILDEHLSPGRTIDLVSVDVEGVELAVLQSNNWAKYRPQWIIIEVLATPFELMRGHPAITYLSRQGYEPVSRLMNSVILQSRN